MKKLIAFLFLSVLLSGCATAARESGVGEHNSLYRSWSHLKFSMSGYRNPTGENVKKSAEEGGWWGIPVPYPPAK